MFQNNEHHMNLTNHTEVSQTNSPIRQHQKSHSSPKLLNNNIKNLIAKSNKYLNETNTLLKKTKMIFPNPQPDTATNFSSGGQAFEIVENLASPQCSFLNNIAPSFISSMPSSNNPSFNHSSLSKFRNFAFVLSLNEKGLTKLTSDMIMNKAHLQILELKNNKLRTVPDEIFQLVNLKCLKMDSNYIKEIPVGLCNSLKQLEILSFYDNVLNKVPVEIANWKQTLIYLNLAENHIDVLPSEIGELSKLNSLHLEHNHFCVLPVSILNLLNLKEFGLDWFKYAWPMLKVVQQWKSIQEEIALRFFNLRRLKLENVTFEKFVLQVSLKKMDFKVVLAKNRTYLHKSALENDIGALRALLTIQSEEINKVDIEDQTALFLSIRNENYLAAKVLLHNGGDPKIGGGVLGSCLNLATAKCQYYLVSDLLKYGADVNRCDIDGNNSLHVLMCLFDSDVTNYKKIAELLLSYGLNPNAVNKHKWAAVHLAIKRGQNQGMKWILEYNEARNDEKGFELLEINSEGGGCMYETFNLNARGGEEKLTPLHLAVLQNNITLVESLIEQGKVDIFIRSKNEKLASNFAIQNIFLFKILKNFERNYIQKTFLNPLIQERRLKALGKDVNLKSEAEISDDSSETRTFQKVKDLNEVTKDKRVFSQRGHTLSTNILIGSNEQRNLYFNKFNVESNIDKIPRIFKPIKQPTIESLNETQISDIEENKSDLDIIFELEGQWGKNMRTFFGSPNNIRQIDALQKVNTLLNKIRPQKNPKVQSIYSKKIATNHIKILSDNLNDIVESLKKSMKMNQVKILDTSYSLAQRLKCLNGVLLFHYKMASLILNYQEEKTLVDQFKRLIETNPNLATLKNGDKPIFEVTLQASTFFNQSHSSLALRWLVYLLLNTNSNDYCENSILKFFVIKLLSNFYYENASSFLQNLYMDLNEPFFLRYEAFQTLKGFTKCENLLRELPKNMIVSMRNNNSSLRPVSLEISREIGNEKLKNYGSNYFSNKKQMLRNENAFGNQNEISKGSDHMISQNLITVNSSEFEDIQNDKGGKSLYEEMKKEEQKINFNVLIFPDEEKKYKIEGYREKENKGKN